MYTKNRTNNECSIRDARWKIKTIGLSAAELEDVRQILRNAGYSEGQIFEVEYRSFLHKPARRR